MSAKTADELRLAGNRFFDQHRYEDAISSYSRAIIKNPVVPIYFTNRALCYMQTLQWDKAVTDCKKALDLDRENAKACYLLGRTYNRTGQFDEALKLLVRANELALSQKINWGDQVTAEIRFAKREIFRREEEKRIQEEIELQTYLNHLIDEDLNKKIGQLKAKKKGTAEFEVISDDAEVEVITEERDLEDQEQTLRKEADLNRDKLNNLFAKVDEKRRKREVPDYLCGKISFEILRDPVITPSGITYDRADIKEHLERVGHFDPVTRAPLTADQLIPNLAMKEVLDHFLSENHWALDT